MDYYDRQDELYHYGRKGMKWGQHIFGKVKSGAARVGKKISDAHQKKKAEKAADRLRKKPYSKLTDAELKERIARMNLEKQLKDLDRQVNPTTEKGSKFLSSATKAAGEAFISAGKEAATNFIKKRLFKALGLEKEEFEGVHAELKKEAEKWKLEADIAKNQKTVDQWNTEKAKKEQKKDDNSSNEGRASQSKKSKNKTEKEPPLEGTVTGSTKKNKGTDTKSKKVKKETVVVESTFADNVGSTSMNALVVRGDTSLTDYKKWLFD